MDKEKAKGIIRRGKENAARIESERHKKALTPKQEREEAQRLEQMRRDAKRGKK